jgi:hypothetical protein
MVQATRLTLDLTGYGMDDGQLAAFTNVFRTILIKAHVEHVKGNVTIPLDGCGHVGTLKIESFHEVAERKNGAKG